MSLSLHAQSVNVSREKLLATLKENLKKHKIEYEQAVIDYRKALQADLTAALVKVNDPFSSLDKIKVDFSHPQSYADQYQQVIDMLEWSTDDVINLDSQAFRAYIKDEWSWKSSFQMLSSTYSAKASAFSAAIGGAGR